MTVLIIYLVGYVVAYVMVRQAARDCEGDGYDWVHVVKAIILSLPSWLLIIAALIHDGKIDFPKPPKWL
jgi:hypothetical protein